MSAVDSLVRHLQHVANNVIPDYRSVILNAIDDLIYWEKNAIHHAKMRDKFSGALMHIGYAAQSATEMQQIAREVLDPHTKNKENSP